MREAELLLEVLGDCWDWDWIHGCWRHWAAVRRALEGEGTNNVKLMLRGGGGSSLGMYTATEMRN